MRQIFLLLLITCSFKVLSQVQFQTISFAAALSQARTQSKLVFVQLEAPDCRQCTEVAVKGLSDKELGNAINQSFVTLYVDATHKDRRQIETLYNIPNGFGTLFIDQEATLIHKYQRTTTNVQEYRNQIDIALTRAGESMKVSELEKAYLTNKSLGLLEQLLLKKASLNLNTNALLNDYVAMLPPDSLASVYTVQFIVGMAPLIGSKAYLAFRKDTSLLNKAWKSMPLQNRSTINARIIEKSLKKAIQEKDEAYAIRTAMFARNLSRNNKEAAEKVFMMKLLEYYEGINDNNRYLSTAVHYYDKYCMTINVDSITQEDKIINKQLFDAAKKDTIKTETGFRLKATIRTSPRSQLYTWELKEGAWKIYQKTSDPVLLSKATTWIKKAIAFFETPEALHVYALLLYKQNEKEQAVNAERKAIELRKKHGFPVSNYDALLNKMQAGLPLND